MTSQEDATPSLSATQLSLPEFVSLKFELEGDQHQFALDLPPPSHPHRRSLTASLDPSASTANSLNAALPPSPSKAFNVPFVEIPPFFKNRSAFTPVPGTASHPASPTKSSKGTTGAESRTRDQTDAVSARVGALNPTIGRAQTEDILTTKRQRKPRVIREPTPLTARPQAAGTSDIAVRANLGRSSLASAFPFVNGTRGAGFERPSPSPNHSPTRVPVSTSAASANRSFPSNIRNAVKAFESSNRLLSAVPQTEATALSSDPKPASTTPTAAHQHNHVDEDISNVVSSDATEASLATPAVGPPIPNKPGPTRLPTPERFSQIADVLAVLSQNANEPSAISVSGGPSSTVPSGASRALALSATQTAKRRPGRPRTKPRDEDGNIIPSIPGAKGRPRGRPRTYSPVQKVDRPTTARSRQPQTVFLNGLVHPRVASQSNAFSGPSTWAIPSTTPTFPPVDPHVTVSHGSPRVTRRIDKGKQRTDPAAMNIDGVEELGFESDPEGQLSTIGPQSLVPPGILAVFKSHLDFLKKRTVSGMPELYDKFQTFWVPQRSNFFMLMGASTTGTPLGHADTMGGESGTLHPSSSTTIQVHNPSFFFWDPLPLVLGGLRCPVPMCRNVLVCAGINQSPRMVIINEQGDDAGVHSKAKFWIVGTRYRCQGCKDLGGGNNFTSWMSWDQELLDSLPPLLRSEFPAMERDKQFYALDRVVPTRLKVQPTNEGREPSQDPFPTSGGAMPIPPAVTVGGTSPGNAQPSSVDVESGAALATDTQLSVPPAPTTIRAIQSVHMSNGFRPSPSSPTLASSATDIPQPGSPTIPMEQNLGPSTPLKLASNSKSSDPGTAVTQVMVKKRAVPTEFTSGDTPRLALHPPQPTSTITSTDTVPIPSFAALNPFYAFGYASLMAQNAAASASANTTANWKPYPSTLYSEWPQGTATTPITQQNQITWTPQPPSSTSTSQSEPQSQSQKIRAPRKCAKCKVVGCRGQRLLSQCPNACIGCGRVECTLKHTGQKNLCIAAVKSATSAATATGMVIPGSAGPTQTPSGQRSSANQDIEGNTEADGDSEEAAGSVDMNADPGLVGLLQGQGYPHPTPPVPS